MTTTDPFAVSASAPSISFDQRPIGTSYTGTILELPSLVQARDYDTGDLASWPDGNPKMTVVTKLSVNGVEMSWWAPKPSSMFAAVAEAQKVAGSALAIGGTVTITYIGDKANPAKPKLNPAKQYHVVYQPPNAFGTDDQQVPSQAPTGQYAEPAPQQQPAAQAPAAATGGPTPEQIAALKAAGVDPATVFPGYQG